MQNKLVNRVKSLNKHAAECYLQKKETKVTCTTDMLAVLVWIGVGAFASIARHVTTTIRSWIGLGPDLVLVHGWGIFHCTCAHVFTVRWGTAIRSSLVFISVASIGHSRSRVCTMSRRSIHTESIQAKKKKKSQKNTE